MFATSLNMRMETLKALTDAAVKLHVSRREIIVRLLMLLMRNVDSFRRLQGNVAYQRNTSGKKWHCFSIKFTHEENEFFTDLRKICKCSVSFLVAIAVEKYLSDLICEKIHGIYKNMRFNFHAIKKDVHRGIVSWQIQWGKIWKRRRQKLESKNHTS